VSYQVRLLCHNGDLYTSFVSVDLDEVWIWIARRRRDGRFTKGNGRRWIEERGKRAFRKGSRWHSRLKAGRT
jgi:hypothetical protein